MEVPARQFYSNAPIQTTIYERGSGRGERLPAQIQPSQQRRRAGKGAADVPVFVSHIQIEPVSPLRVSGERPGEGGPETPLLGVPPKHRLEVKRFAPEIEELRIDGLERETAKERKQRFPPGASPPVSLTRAKDQVEISVRTRFEIESVIGEDVQTVHSRLSGLQIGKVEHGGRSEGKGVIEQYRINFRRRVERRPFDPRLGNVIPARERRLEVALQEIDARQKIVGVSISRIEPERASQIAGGLRVVLLLEGDPGQLQKKTFVAGLLSEPVLKSPPSFVPAFQASQRCSVVIVEIGGTLNFNFRKPNDLQPAFFREELFDLGWRLVFGERTLRPEGKRRKGENKKDGSRLHPEPFLSVDCGKASNVHWLAPLHCFSKSFRDCLSSLRRAGSFSDTIPAPESSPATTT